MPGSARVEKLADLTTLGAGAAIEKFQSALRDVMDNIKDPNTQAKAKRKIVLEFLFLPQEDREMVMVGITAKSVLPSTKPTADTLFIGRRDGETVGTVLRGEDGDTTDHRQGILPLTRKAGEQ